MSVTSFVELGLSPEILRAVTESGYTTPTPIQAQAIPVVLAGRDVMGGAKRAPARRPVLDCPSCTVCSRRRMSVRRLPGIRCVR